MIKQKYIPELPNPNSGGQTPASLAIDIHYMNLLLVERWNWERYVKLCVFLKMTEYEVASLVRLPHKYIERYREGYTLPMYRGFSESVALTLTILESYLMKGVSPDIVENIFPNLNSIKK